MISYYIFTSSKRNRNKEESNFEFFESLKEIQKESYFMNRQPSYCSMRDYQASASPHICNSTQVQRFDSSYKISTFDGLNTNSQTIENAA